MGKHRLEHAVTFGELIKERRSALGLTQAELAELVGCASETIQKVETGKRRPSKQIAGLLAQNLQIAPEELAHFLEAAQGIFGTHDSWEARGAPPISPPTNLPAQLTRLIGRDEAASEVSDYLLRDSVRLLTLTGAPGIGKTRLAIEIASRLRKHFLDGIYFVALAPITEPDLVLVEVAQVLGLKETGNRSALEALLQVLPDREMLLVLDNFEQVIPAGTVVARLLESCPHVKALATSREPLRVKGERQFPVQPLALPDTTHLAEPEELSRNPAVDLFVESAQAVQPDFALTGDNAQAVASICAGLDGLPLAIELVAARVKMLPPQALLARLNNRLALLTGGVRNGPARQQALRQAIDWSYDLLGAEEQTLFRQLGVFSGGCTLSAVETVVGMRNAELGMRNSSERDIPHSYDVLELMGSLLDKSLLKREERTGAEPQSSEQETRFSMLETILEYARWRLQESGEDEAVHRLHAEYYLALAEASDPRIAGPELKLWLDRLEREHDNLRSAIQWCMTSGDTWLGLRLATSLGFFWEVRGYYAEGRAWLAGALERDTGRAREHRLLHARALLLLGRLVVAQDEYRHGRNLFERVLEIGNEVDDKVTQAYALCHIGWADVLMREFARGRPLIDRGLELFEGTEETWGPIEGYNFKGMCAHGEGRYEDAANAYAQSAKLAAEAHDPWQAGLALVLWGQLALVQEDYQVACARLQGALEQGRELDDKWMVESALAGLSHVLLIEGHVDDAVPLVKEGLALSASLGYPTGTGAMLVRLAWAAGLRRQFGVMAKLLGAGTAIFEEKQLAWDTLRKRLRPVEESARNEIDVATWDREFNAGKAMPLREAIRYALDAKAG